MLLIFCALSLERIKINNEMIVHKKVRQNVLSDFFFWVRIVALLNREKFSEER